MSQKKISSYQISHAISTLKILNEIPHDKRIALDPRLNYESYDYQIEALEVILIRMQKESDRVKAHARGDRLNSRRF